MSDDFKKPMESSIAESLRPVINSYIIVTIMSRWSSLCASLA
jgi:hypothetical protein